MDTTRDVVDRFVSVRTMAVVGVSSSGRGFGNMAYRELKKRGYRLLPVHPKAASIQGDPCWPSIAELPERVERLLVVVKPELARQVVADAADAGVRSVWLQQGAQSPAAIDLGRERGLDVIHGHCVLMFAAPTGWFHAVHRWLWKVLGKLPR